MKEVEDIFPDYHDGEFLAPKSGAKLASLFDLDRAESQGNESFQFTAPKQPKKFSTTTGPPPQKPAPSPTAPAVLFAAGVHTFRLVNGQYMKQGKLGAAVLGNHVIKEYTLLLYGSQQKHITTARIYPGFVLTVQPGNYTMFYDDQHQNWSLKFDTEKAVLDFSKEVCLARWNSQACVDTLMIQDLLQGEGQAVDVGDTVEVVFTGWLFQNHTIGQIFDSNIGKNKLQRVRLGSGKAPKGWEEGMIGIKKGGRRLLIVPPSINGSKGIPGCVPLANTLVFDVEICQASFSKHGDCLSGGSTDSTNASSVPSLDNTSTEQSAICISSDQGVQGQRIKSGPVNEPPKNISESGMVRDSSPPNIIPSSSPQPVEITSKPISYTGEISSKPVAIQHSEASTACFPQRVDISSGQAFQPYVTSRLQPFASVFPPQHMLCEAADLSSFLMTEARQHNTEIRLAVGRVADRVDQLTSKVDDLQKQGFCSFGLSSVSLETAMILQSIQRIVQENTCLKKEVFEKGSKVEEQNHKIGELIEQRQWYMEQSNMLMEQRNNAMQNSNQHNHDRLLQAEQEKGEAVHHQQRTAELQTKLDAALEEGRSCCALINSLEAQVEELKKEGDQSQQQWRTEKQKYRKMELKMKIMEEEIHDLRAEKEALNQRLLDRKRKWQLERERLLMEHEEQRRSSEEENQQLCGQLRRERVCTEMHTRRQLQTELEWQERCAAAVQEQRVKLEEVINQLQEQCATLQKEVESERQQLKGQLAVQVKQVMNGLFHSLRTQFDMQEFYSGDSVLKILLKTIKQVTMQLLEGPQEMKSETGDDEDDEEEEYLSTEETDKGENMEESGKKHDPFQISLDQTYVTADETADLESPELSSDSSTASVLDGQPVDTQE
ncbi:FK506-binding protein 15 isoform X5 [Pygocentrus nattereri]|uniref:peptidylprolyl isomerase n=1 Tax=Pygocentrus nattereri TaxID=42514 RepID=A0A3B4EF01_PYGNA|nr:FK506-binding protein 15 isoform X5 [Pygocentrus nattereri]